MPGWHPHMLHSSWSSNITTCAQTMSPYILLQALLAHQHKPEPRACSAAVAAATSCHVRLAHTRHTTCMAASQYKEPK
jgi:hypothetical protein